MKANLVDDVEQYKMLWDYGNDLKKEPTHHFLVPNLGEQYLQYIVHVN
jgi:hypothetical protein